MKKKIILKEFQHVYKSISEIQLEMDRLKGGRIMRCDMCGGRYRCEVYNDEGAVLCQRCRNEFGNRKRINKVKE